MKVDEKRISDAFISSLRVEVELREVLKKDLDRHFGPAWRIQIPDKHLDGWGKIRANEIEMGRDRGPDLIDYATLSESISLIFKFWEAFEQRFGNKDFIAGQIEEYRMLRNLLVHDGVNMGLDDCNSLEHLTSEIIQKCRVQYQDVAEKSPPTKSKRNEQTPTHMLSELNKGQLEFMEFVELMLPKMLGKLSGELDALIKFLQTNIELCSYPLLGIVKEHFRNLEETEKEIDDLKKDIPPQYPRTPRSSWSSSKMLKWATREYIPYRAWMNRKEHFDKLIDNFSIIYEEWLTNNYPFFLSQGNENLVLNSYQHVEACLKKGDVIWLIVDNLSLFWLPIFYEELKKLGMEITDHRRMLAMLPSTSEISRRSMIAGQLPKDAVMHKSDKLACSNLWEDRGYSVAYCTTPDEIDAALDTNKPLIVVLYNELDKIAHKSKDSWFDRDEAFCQGIQKILNKIAETLRSKNNVKPTQLLISTDHGAIWPNKDTKVIKVDSSFPAILSSDKHKRYCAVDNVIGFSEIDFHKLDKVAFQTPHSYLVAKGNKVFERVPRGYTHGGLSPEETITMLLYSSPGQRGNLKLRFEHLGEPLFRGRKGNLKLLIRNPFGIPIENLIINIPSYKLNFEPLDIQPLSEVYTSEKIITLLDNQETKDNMTYIKIAYHYRISGSKVVDSGYLAIKVSTLYKSSEDSFDEMFG
ncbi:MAG: PglZ domain-containing protein [Candidatus Brocadiales bacterium]|nr:PglZ domain-containing protein [Candidatus Brocadiales bacterium]